MLDVGGINSNINYIDENNYNILPKGTDVWMGKLPYDTGTIFPTPEIKYRALISNTNRLIYNNEVDEIYSNIISVFPEIDPMYGWQIREIIANLPYFKNATNYWTGLICGEPPIIDGDDSVDIKVSEIIENSNWGTTIQNEVKSRFMDVISAYRVDIDINNKPTIVSIDSKNLVCFVSKTFTTSVEVNVVFNIYTDETGKQLIEFIEYHYNGEINKKVFEYSNGIIGKHLEDLDESSVAFNGRFKMSPIVVFKHNATGNAIYGTDQYRYWSASILGAMRELQNIFRLGERTREMIRKVPESSIKKDPTTGSSMFFNRGTISYPDGSDKSPDIEYIVPNINMDAAIKSFEKAIKSVSIDTNLGPVFFDLEKLGTNLSAKSIEAALYPTKLEARRIKTEMTSSVRELAIKLCAIANVDIADQTKFNVIWFDGFPQDVKDYTDAIQSRLGGSQSISLEDAIIKLDKVPTRIALQKATEIKQSLKDSNTDDKDKLTDDKIDANADLDIDDNNKFNTHGIGVNAGDGKNNIVSVVKPKDDTVWETQMLYPRDVGFNHSKEMSNRWILKKLRKSHMN